MSGTMFKRSNEPRSLDQNMARRVLEDSPALGTVQVMSVVLDDSKSLINAAAAESSLTGEYNSPCQYRIYISSLHVSRLHYSVNGVGRSSAYFGRTVPQVLFN